MSAPGRFRDPLHHVEHFLDEVLVACPRCGGRAVVRPRPDSAPGRWWAVPRVLVCGGCGHAERSPERSTVTLREPRDPFFGAPLWLSTACRGHLLWAYNTDHVDALEHYVAARLRERGEVPGSMSMLERLPAWIKRGKHREDVLRALGRLRERADSATR